MSSSDRPNRLKQFATTVAALLVLITTSACVRPLYGNASVAGSARQELTAVDVAPIPDVSGHYLREELLFNLSGGSDSAVQPKYKLSITISERTVSAAVDTTSGRADAAALQLTARYKLTTLAGGTLTEGTAFASSSIDRLSQRYAAVRAVRDAKIRVAKVLAEQIETRLAAFFASAL
jgi:LPS-assembly lipoprotein